jgi:hypothetical protein
LSRFYYFFSLLDFHRLKLATWAGKKYMKEEFTTENYTEDIWFLTEPKRLLPVAQLGKCDCGKEANQE